MNQKLDQIDFHDQGLKNLHIDFALKTIRLLFSLYNDEEKKYHDLEVQFFGVNNIKIDEMELPEVSELEISSFKIDEIRKELQISALTYFSGPSIDIKFGFEKYSLETI
jgi:hypothetical protein